MIDVIRWILIAAFWWMGIGLLGAAQGSRGRILVGLLAGAACYCGAATVAIAQKSFVPIGIGFAVAWMLRFLRFDPGWPDEGILFSVPEMGGLVRLRIVPQMQLIEMLRANGFDKITLEEVVNEYWKLKQPKARVSAIGVQCLKVLEDLDLLERNQTPSADRTRRA